MRSLLAIFIILCSLPVYAAGPVSSGKPIVKVGGWLVFWNPDSLAGFERNAAHIDEAMAEWITCGPDGQATRIDRVTPAQRAQTLKIARAHKIKLFGMVQNGGGFDAKRVETFLYDDAKRRMHISQLVQIAKEDHLSGIDIDYESLAARDRDPFTAFVEQLAAALHKEHKLLSVVVHAKESEPGTWDGPKAHDYAKIGAAADLVRIMCYDFHWETSDPGAIAPTDWVERVMTFASSVIPKQKLALGVPCYGYDWTTKPAGSLTWKDWQPHATGQMLDPLSGECVNGKCYFAGAEAAKAKIALAQRLGISRISIWYIGSEEPAFWDVVAGKP